MSGTVTHTMADGAHQEHDQRNDVAEKAPAKARSNGAGPMSNALLQLQATAGNAATAAYVQTKLVVGHAADPAEHEADAIADEVLQRLRRPSDGDDGNDGDQPPTVRRSSGGGSDPLGGAEVDQHTNAAIERARGGGRPLSGDVRGQMESGFGHDFGSVRIHEGGESDRLNRVLQAQAFTTGRDIFFSGSSFQPQTNSGQQLLAHELAHVVQQGGAVSRRTVQRKMWTKAAFAKATSEGALTRKSDVQERLEVMITEYIAAFESHGVVATDDLARALDQLLQMKQSVDWWIDDHVVDVDNNLGGVDTIEDPSRKKRMKGMKDFRSYLNSEISAFQREQRRQTKDDGTEGDITTEIKEKTAGFLVLERKYTGDAKSFLEKIGSMIEKAVPDEGDSTELEIEVEFPIDPSGVGFLGGRFKAEVERDGGVRMRAELAITGGANIAFAKIKGEIGGYIEASGENGADCMDLFSYALYRRFRESAACPNEVANYMWGGDTGKYGFGKAEQWSLDLEKKLFDIPDPDPADPKYLLAQQGPPTKGGTPPYNTVLFEKDVAEVAEKREKIYVESGGLVGVTAELDAVVLSGEVAIAYTEGRRIDWESLKNRKGGAGQKNLASSGVLAKGARAISGGTRGAQKKVSRDARTLSISSKLEATVPGGIKLGGGVALALEWMSDGARKSEGQTPVTSLTGNELEVSFECAIPLAELVGPGLSTVIGKFADMVTEWIREKALPKAQDEAGEPKTKGKGTVGKIAEGVKAVNSGVEQLKGTDAGSEPGLVEQLTGAASESSSKIELVLTLDGIEGGGSFEIKRGSELEVDVPKIIAIKLSRSKRVLKVEYKAGVWTVS
jgi:hypothetical protein